MAAPPRLPGLVVLASTYPRWAKDPEPGFVHELAQRLTSDFHVTVIAPHAPGALEQERLDGVQVVRYRYAPERWETLVNEGGIISNLRRSPWKLLLLPTFVLCQWWAVRRVIRESAPSVLHAHWLVPQGLIAATQSPRAANAVPFLVTSHGADLFALRGRVFRRLKAFVLRRAAIVTVVSSAMTDEVEALSPGVTAVVAPMGVDLEGRFCPDAQVARVEDEALFVGRLVEKKGVAHLVEAWPRVVAVRPEARLRIVGFGPLEASLRLRCQQLGVASSIEFVGAIPQSELPGHYRRAAVFVAPFVAGRDGDQEGLGLVTVEAIGTGCPVVVGDVPAVRDVVTGPEVGTIVDARNPEALAAAVVAAMAGSAPAPDGVAQFGWQSRASQYRRLLSAAVSKHGIS